MKNEVLRKEEEPETVAIKEVFQSWLIVHGAPLQSTLYVSLLQINLHQGEVEIISLAKQLQETTSLTSVVNLDDLDARDIAKALNLIVTGTIGILVAITQQKKISVTQCRQYIVYLLNSTSFRISSTALLQIEARLEDLEKTS